MRQQIDRFSMTEWPPVALLALSDSSFDLRPKEDSSTMSSSSLPKQDRPITHLNSLRWAHILASNILASPINPRWVSTPPWHTVNKVTGPSLSVN